MKRFLAPLALALIAGTTAHAQTITRSYSTTDGWGGSISMGSVTSVTGQIANQTISGGFPNYAGGVATYGNSNYPAPTYNYFYAPTYNSSNYNYPANYGYGYNPYGAYLVPGQTIPLGQSRYGWDRPPTITTLPQIVNNGVSYPYYPYATYPALPNYGFSATAVLPNGSISYSNTTIANNSPINPGINRPNTPNRRDRPSRRNR